MSGLVALLSLRPDRAQLGRRALAYLSHLPSQVVEELDDAGVWLGAVGRPGSAGTARAAGPNGESRDKRHDPARASGSKASAAVACGTILGAASIARELGIGEPADPAALVLAAYQRWGRKGLLRLEGAFAYALVLRDAEGPRLLTGGDLCGAMRVTAIILGDDALVATEAKAFLAHPSFRPALDESAAVRLLMAACSPRGQSLFKGTVTSTFDTFFDVRPGRIQRVSLWDLRDHLGAMRGQAYLDVLSEAIVGMARDAFTEGNGGGKGGERQKSRPILPLTGGLDSRLLAAAAPPDAHPQALTFGPGNDADCVLGRRLAQVRGFKHVVMPLDERYLARTAAATVWLSEGRVNPTLNITTFLMADLADRPAFVSGQGGEIGRRFRKTHLLWPDQTLLHDNAGFEQRMVRCVRSYALEPEAMRRLLGPALQKASLDIDQELSRIFAETRGLHPVDRVDLYHAKHAFREFCGPTLALPELYLGVRAPYLTRRWLCALLSGAPDERRDDLVRLRLISQLDPRVARVPWALTHLPLPASVALLTGLRGASWAAYHLRQQCPPAIRARMHAHATLPVGRLKELVYSHGERRDDWLRTTSRAFVEGLLSDGLLAEQGLFEPAAVREVLSAEFAGAERSFVLGGLIDLTLWHSLFVERDASLVGAVREQVATGAVRPDSPTPRHEYAQSPEAVPAGQVADQGVAA